jgi:hypothetical protein
LAHHAYALDASASRPYGAKMTDEQIESMANACGLYGARKAVVQCVRELLKAHPDHSGDGGETVAAHVTLPAPDTTHYAQWAGDTIKYHSDGQIYEFASARVKAALASNKATEARCQYCDGTGDVHSIDGEWRGECTECGASNKAAPIASVLSDRDIQEAALEWQCDPAFDHFMFHEDELVEYVRKILALTHPAAAQLSRAEVLLKLRAAQMCHPNAVQPLIEEAIDLLEDKP